jgi:hypothetical protein
MVYEIKSFVGTCSYAQIPRPLPPLYSIEEYEDKMEALTIPKKERRYTM